MKRALVIFCFISLSSYPMCGYSQITSLPWSCNYDSCPDWTYGQTMNCCGLDQGGPWACNGTGYEQINSTTGYGGSGKAQIHWVGAGDDNQAGGTTIKLVGAAQVRELYIRFYIKYEPGYDCGTCSYNKDLYIDHGIYGLTLVAGWIGSDYVLSGGDSIRCSGGCGWQIFSDNQWHWIEIHLKYGAGDGVKELWIDGVLRASGYNLNFGQSSYTFREIHVGSNQGMPSHSGCKYRAYDNIAISTTGPIGPVGGGGVPNPPPSPPRGFGVQ